MVGSAEVRIITINGNVFTNILLRGGIWLAPFSRASILIVTSDLLKGAPRFRVTGIHCAYISVIAINRLIHAIASLRITRIVRTGVAVVAVDQYSFALRILADVALRTEVAVAAFNTIIYRSVDAFTGHRVAFGNQAIVLVVICTDNLRVRHSFAHAVHTQDKPVAEVAVVVLEAISVGLTRRAEVDWARVADTVHTQVAACALVPVVARLVVGKENAPFHG